MDPVAHVLRRLREHAAELAASQDADRSSRGDHGRRAPSTLRVCARRRASSARAIAG